MTKTHRLTKADRVYRAWVNHNNMPKAVSAQTLTILTGLPSRVIAHALSQDSRFVRTEVDHHTGYRYVYSLAEAVSKEVSQ